MKKKEKKRIVKRIFEIAEDGEKCSASEDGEHTGWEFPNGDIVCLDCGKML
jgi:hypothetical protein